MTKPAADLYKEDFVLWAEGQAAALREAASAGTNLPLDWENLAEEVESLAGSQRRELRSRIGTIMEHLLKLQYSRSENPRRGWVETIVRERSDIELLLEDSPSLRNEVVSVIRHQSPRQASLTAKVMAGRGETVAIPAPDYTEEQVLGDWFPEAAKPAPRSPRRSGRPRRGRGAASRGAS
jgi:hypothetical protein